MDHKIKLHFTGHRFKLMFLRLVMFISVMSLYSMNPGTALIVAVIIVGYYLLFYIRGHRGDRQRQLTSETIEAYPNATAEVLRQVYRALHARQMRFDAALYLFMAVYASVWILLLNQVEAFNAWALGRAGIVMAWILAGGLLIAGLALFVLSFFPGIFEGTEKKPVPSLEDYIEKRTGREMLTQRVARPDFRTFGRAICTANLESVPEKGMASDILKASDWSTGARIALILLRIFIDIVVAMWTIMCLSRGSGYLVAGFIILSFFVLLKVFWGLAKKHGPYLLKKYSPGKSMQKLQKSSVMVQDIVLSTLPSQIDATALEFCFDQTGTVAATCSLHDYQKLRNIKEKKAFLLRDEKRVYWVGFLKEALTEEPEPAETQAADAAMIQSPAEAVETVGIQPLGESAPVEMPGKVDIRALLAEGKIPNNEQLHAAAVARLYEMDPAVKKQWKSELDEHYELVASGKHINGTPAEKSRSSMLLSQSLARTREPVKYDGLFYMDKQLVEKEKMSREEVMAQKDVKVPFRVYLPLIIAAVFLIIAVPVLALIRRETGLDLTWVSILLSSITGIIAMGLAGNLISTHRTKKNFQKLKKAYLDPEFWDAKIEIEAYSIFEKETWAANRAKDKEKEGACHR